MLSAFFHALGTWIAQHTEAFLSAIGLALAIIAWALDHRLRRPRLLYRVQVDTPLSLAPAVEQNVAEVVVRANGADVPAPSVALIRITNTGSLPIHPADFVHPLTFDFNGRTVVGYEVAENDDAKNQLTADEPASRRVPSRRSFWTTVQQVIYRGRRAHERSSKNSTNTANKTKLVLPPFRLDERQRFKLLVVLSGNGSGVTADDAKHLLRNGKLVRDLSGSGPSRRTMIYIVIVAVLVGAAVMAALLPHAQQTSNPGITCVPGTITVTGSTAFMPAVHEIAQDYENACLGSTINVSGTGSIAGLSELAAGKQRDEATVYDGAAPSGSYPDLVSNKVAAMVFAVVVNWDTEVHNLTVNQLQGIFSGQITNWSQVSNSLPAQPITVIGRDSESGTRAVFTNTVLAGKEEYERTSQNCSSLDPGQSPSTILLCEMPNTQLVLERVNSIPGAIGYAEVSASNTFPNVYRIQIQNHDPDILQDTRPGYPFWATEHVYTYGIPASDSLLGAFLAFMNSKAERDAMQKHGAIPCADLGQTPTQPACSN